MVKQLKAVPAVKATKKKADGSQSNPFPWVEPYPASKLDEDGKTETVFVKALITQDIICQGVTHKTGRTTTLPAGLAHAFAHALAAPKE